MLIQNNSLNKDILIGRQATNELTIKSESGFEGIFNSINGILSDVSLLLLELQISNNLKISLERMIAKEDFILRSTIMRTWILSKIFPGDYDIGFTCINEYLFNLISAHIIKI